MEPLTQIASFCGAVFILAGYFGLQAGKFSEFNLVYLGLNFTGASMLLFSAWYTGQIGFILLEGAWVLVTVFGFLKRFSRLSS
ncbi:MAG: hypothetical protein A2Z83_05260 [Omnitrophica bacterium GWA2_52_8]|nr:MAG: hypothetical protein A2Z83_05260 [Omnitrophica bacterium GWA2_52_8]